MGGFKGYVTAIRGMGMLSRSHNMTYTCRSRLRRLDSIQLRADLNRPGCFTTGEQGSVSLGVSGIDLLELTHH